ncbi:MAG: helix-turn-helix transcriptional regulator [Methylobacter sp.]|jgi:DNA-binding NarL/FixJ family response regulator
MEPVACYAVGGAGQLPGKNMQSVDCGLTQRELEVLTLVCDALPDKVIARRLAVSAKTISTFLEHIYLKLGVRGSAHNARCAAMLAAFDLGLVSVPQRH